MNELFDAILGPYTPTREMEQLVADSLIQQQLVDAQEQEIIPTVFKRTDDFEAFTRPASERPSDDELLLALVFYFGASEATTINWLAGMDLEFLMESIKEQE
jgi:hypothetical protein